MANPGFFHSHGIQFTIPTQNLNVPDQSRRLTALAALQKNPCCKMLLLLFATISTALVLVWKLVSGPGSLAYIPSGSDTFSPHISLVFPVTGLYCDSFSISKYPDSSPSSQWNTSLYLLHKAPDPLQTGRYNFTVSKGGVGDFLHLESGEYYEWSFYLLHGSQYSVSACASLASSVKLYVLQGESDFDDWTKSQSSATGHMLPPCNTTNKPVLITAEKIPDVNKYYFVYKSVSVDSTTVWIQMNFTSLDYAINTSPSNLFANCSCLYSNSKCSLSLPMDFKGVAVVKTFAPEDASWEEQLYVTWVCDASYIAYVLLFCLPVAFVMICLFLVSLIHQLCTRTPQVSPQRRSQPYNVSQAMLLFAMVRVIFMLGFIYVMSMLVLLAIQFLQFVLKFISFGSPYVSLAVLSMATGVLCCSVSCKILFSCATNRITRVANQPTVNTPGQVHPIRNRQSQQENNPVATNEYQHDATELRARKKRIISMYKCTSISFIGSWCILSAVISICMLTLLEAVFPLLVYSDSLQFNKTFMPGDTNLFSFNSFFCGSYTIEGHGSSHLSATLSVSNELPPLSTSIIIINRTNYLPSNWTAEHNIYLREQSSVVVSACLVEGRKAQFVVVKGSSNYYNWVVSKLPMYTFDYLNVQSNCTLSWDEKQIHIESADRYYFVLYDDSNHWSNVSLVLNLSRVEYSPYYKNGTLIENCSISPHTVDTCTAHAPGIGDMTGLITVSYDPSDSTKWDESVKIKGSCNLRADTWTVLWIPMILVNTLIFVPLLCYFANIWYRRSILPFMKSEERQPLLRHQREYGSTETTHSVSGTGETIRSADIKTEQDPPDIGQSTQPSENNEITSVTIESIPSADTYTEQKPLSTQPNENLLDNAPTTSAEIGVDSISNVQNDNSPPAINNNSVESLETTTVYNQMKDTSATDGVTAGTTAPHCEENQQGVREQAGTDNIDDSIED